MSQYGNRSVLDIAELAGLRTCDVWQVIWRNDALKRGRKRGVDKLVNAIMQKSGLNEAELAASLGYRGVRGVYQVIHMSLGYDVGERTLMRLKKLLTAIQ